MYWRDLSNNDNVFKSCIPRSKKIQLKKNPNLNCIYNYKVEGLMKKISETVALFHDQIKQA